MVNVHYNVGPPRTCSLRLGKSSFVLSPLWSIHVTWSFFLSFVGKIALFPNIFFLLFSFDEP